MDSYSGHTSRDPILLGRKISPEWLQEQVRLIEFSFEGQLFDAFSTLLNAAKQEKKNLPITSLRTALIAGNDRIVRLDRDLGLLPDDGGKFGCAVSMFPDIDDDDTYSKARAEIAKYVSSWVINDVEPWAERNGMGSLAAKLKKQVNSADICGSEKMVSPITQDGRSPDFALIARTIAERLIGEELFDGMKECELVASPESRSNSIELMTLPKHSMGSNITDVTFSVPGSPGLAATVRGMGVVFSDVDYTGSASLEVFDTSNVSLGLFPVEGVFPTADGRNSQGSFSFLGVSFDAGERVARVRIVSGAHGIDGNYVGLDDAVVMDDSIYAEPQAVPEPLTSALVGAGIAGHDRFAAAPLGVGRFDTLTAMTLTRAVVCGNQSSPSPLDLRSAHYCAGNPGSSSMLFFRPFHPERWLRI